MAQKMQTYDEMSTTKGHPWVPQESQDYVLRSPKVERNKSSRPSDTVPCPCALKELHYLKGRLNNWYPNTHLRFIFSLTERYGKISWDMEILCYITTQRETSRWANFACRLFDSITIWWHHVWLTWMLDILYMRYFYLCVYWKLPDTETLSLIIWIKLFNWNWPAALDCSQSSIFP